MGQPIMLDLTNRTAFPGDGIAEAGFLQEGHRDFRNKNAIGDPQSEGLSGSSSLKFRKSDWFYIKLKRKKTGFDEDVH